MNPQPKFRLFRNLLACCLLVIGLFGPPVQMAHSASIVTDGDIVGGGVSLEAVKTALCAQLVAEGVTPLPQVCSVGLEERLAFHTSNPSGGNFLAWANNLGLGVFTDGLLAADAVCQHYADNASSPLPGTYKAWLSTDTVDAKTRIGNHKWLLTDGTTVIAEGLGDLMDCTKGAGGDECLGHAIDLDENGGQPSGITVFTGTESDGTATTGVPGTNNCGGWTSSLFEISGRAGNSTFTTGLWTASGAPVGCDNSLSILCFGQ